jgi:hypothetical protein
MLMKNSKKMKKMMIIMKMKMGKMLMKKKRKVKKILYLNQIINQHHLYQEKNVVPVLINTPIMFAIVVCISL